MTLRQTKRVINKLAISAGVCVALVLVVQKAAMLLAIVMMLLAAAILAISLIFWRCPHCGKHLGRDSKSLCQHCGKELDLSQ